MCAPLASADKSLGHTAVHEGLHTHTTVLTAPEHIQEIYIMLGSYTTYTASLHVDER